jgi:crotonobetainyl-CoA:carnitine CoA-transferase CaiB-like acyl-CoA transferase
MSIPMSEAGGRTGPLDGLVVLDLSTNLASAFTTLLFADFGAEVIQVERPGGSPLRRLAAWPFWLRGKKSVVLDLHDAGDLDVARSLGRSADVVVEAFGPGAADRLGLGYDALRDGNPGLVYTSITGFGHDGPFAHLKAHEAVVMAKTGSMYGNIAPDRPGEPVMATPYGATFAGSFLAMQGTLLALHERDSSGHGHGQRVDATMVQGMLAQDPWSYFMKILASRYPDAFTAVGAPAAGRRVPTSWLGFGLLNGYSRDGKWLQFAHATPRQFEAFVRALGLEWARSDPEWKDAPDGPDEAVRDRWWSMMLEGVRQRSVEEWQAVFDADKDVFAEVYLDGLELFDHPQIVHDGHRVQVDDPDLGPVHQMGPLVKMSSTPGDPTRPAPAVDAHGPELRDRAGRRDAESGRSVPTAPAPESVLPLEGITVVDLGTFYAGPFSSTMLADHGASVIKIEPLDGDPIRFQMPVPESAGVRVTQGKKSVAVDVFHEEGKAIVVELIRRADIVLHTYRGGVAARMGLDADSMRALNPDLVYHHGVGYGIDGPYARRAAFAPTIAAASGFARRCGGGGPEGSDLSLEEIKDATIRMGGVQPGHPDGMAALGVAVGLLLGLYSRDRGAGGQVTLTSMLSTVGHVLSDSLVNYRGVAAPPVTDPDGYGFSALYRLYRASDAWIVLCAPDDHSWSALASALSGLSGLSGDVPGLDLDERFADAAARQTHDSDLAAVLTKVFEGRPAGNWERLLSEAGVGCAEVAPSQGGLAMGLFEEGGVCDQLGMLTTVTHPIFEEHIRSRELVRLSRGRSTLGAGCTIGQHTDEVLREYLGYEDERISRLRAEGVVGG